MKLAASLISLLGLVFAFGEPSFVVMPEVSWGDREISLKVMGLQPHESVRLEAELIDNQNRTWVSSASFLATDRGEVDLSRDSPFEGSYKGIDPMGLFWSMQPRSKEVISFATRNESHSMSLKLFSGDRQRASKEIVRLLRAPHVERFPLQKDGLVGILFLPHSNEPLPAVMTLGGSDGEIGEHRAQMLASYGFATLALAYFGKEGLPSGLQEIPLEYFEKALKWLHAHPLIDTSRIGLYGVSRGAELALILGSLFPHAIKSIVAALPSSVIYPGFSLIPCNAWLYQNKALAPFALPSFDLFLCTKGSLSNPLALRKSIISGMKDQQRFQEAAIPVENLLCPLLLISGGDDQIWPSDLFSEQILQRLKEKGSSISCEHLYYPKAGHQISVPYWPGCTLYKHPQTQLWFNMGGTPQEDDLASRDSWKKIIRFFQNTLLPRCTYMGDAPGARGFYTDVKDNRIGFNRAESIAFDIGFDNLREIM